MKKYLIVLAAAVVALASCNKGSEGGGSEYTKLAFKETSITLAVDESAKLNQDLTWEPSSLVAPTCEWASSDTAVATVNQNGLVTAVAQGEANITAKLGDLTAVCKVTVMSFEESWAPSSTVYYFSSTKSAAPVSDTTIVYETQKATYTCKLYSIELCIPSDVAIPGDEDGAGDYIFVTASIPFIESSTSGEYIGEPWDLAFQIAPAEVANDTEFGAVAGALDPAIIGSVWQAYLEQLAAGQEPSFDKDTYLTGATGAQLRAALIDGNQISSYPWFDAIVTNGYFYTEYDSDTEEYTAKYQLQIDWCAGFWNTGLKFNEEATSYADALAQPFQLELSRYMYKDGEKGVPANAAQKKQVRAQQDTKGMVKLGTLKKLDLVKYKEAK